VIDFRYHLVSLVAVFMALAVGIALGAGPLKDPVDTALGNQTEELRKEKEELRAQVRDLEAQLAFDEELATISAPPVLDGTLAGRSVLLVSLPGSDPEQLALLKGAAETAGARVTGTVAVQDSYTAPDQAVILGDPTTLRTDDLILAYARFVDGLAGRYVTAEDVGTTQADMDLIRTITPHVTGTSEAKGGSGDPSPATALGVLWAMKAVAERLWGRATLEGR